MSSWVCQCRWHPHTRPHRRLCLPGCEGERVITLVACSEFSWPFAFYGSKLQSSKRERDSPAQVGKRRAASSSLRKGAACLMAQEGTLGDRDRVAGSWPAGRQGTSPWGRWDTRSSVHRALVTRAFCS